MGDVRQVLDQLRSLAKEPENREYILQDRTCFHGLIKFLDHQDHDIIFGALEVLQFLCGNARDAAPSNENVINANRQQMANDLELVSRLKRLMFDYNLPPNAKKLAGNTYATLQKYINVDKVPITNPVTSTSESSQPAQMPLRDTTNTQGNSGVGLGFFSEKVTHALSNAKTYTFYIKSLNTEASRMQLESVLLAVKGIISFSLDVRAHRAVIRSSLASSDLLNGLKSAGVTDASLFPVDLDGKVNNENEPQYLPEPTQSSWFSSIVTWGMADQRKPQKTTTKNAASNNGGFMSRLKTSLNVF
eukprot:TRINITY_DN1532_c0_g1_i1.p1 TRINITY_DN1532_c0_g1~~TRINITY_DN1532_c0_g1_i1.p1  ORF type:complete len:303 (+),score=70.72 TRINITY_DN1532_c0_g1_i1:82-990(+)